MQARPLTAKESQILSSDRNAVESALGRKILSGTQADLPALQALLTAAPRKFSGSRALASLGTAFGDVLASEIGLNWVMVTDRLGTDHALQFQNAQVFVFPRSMLLKRVSRGEKPQEIDLTFMLGEIRSVVHEQALGAARVDL